MKVFNFLRGPGGCWKIAAAACLLLAVLMGCHNQNIPHDNTPAGRGPAPAPPSNNKTKVNEFDPRLTWSGRISISNSSAYQKVLEGFGVCGGAGWHVSIDILAAKAINPRSCKYWFGQARVRLNFLKKDLPAKARLRIYPSYSLSGRRQGGGRGMFLQGVVKKINDSEGFTGDLYGGTSVFAVHVTSQRNTPEDNDMILHTTFGIDPYTHFGRTSLKNEAGQGKSRGSDDEFVDTGR